MNKGYFYVGLALFAFVIGGLVGVSQSPVAGVVVTAIFGVITAIVASVLPKKEKEDKTPSPNIPFTDFRFVGLILILFSILFPIGIVVGVNIKVSEMQPKEQDFIWNSKNQPKSVYEALDWIAVSSKLEQAGYNKDQIRAIYNLRKDCDTIACYQYSSNNLYINVFKGKDQIDLNNQIFGSAVANEDKHGDLDLDNKKATF